MRITDSAPHQCGIEYDRLHESISGASKGFILIRFIYTTGRIGPAVNEYTFPISIDKKNRHAGKSISYNLVKILRQIHLYIRYAFLQKSFRILRHVLLRHRKKGIHDLQHCFIFNESVNVVEYGRLSSDLHLPAYDIKAFLHRQGFVHISDILFKRSAELFTVFFYHSHCSPFLPKDNILLWLDCPVFPGLFHFF